MTKPSKIYKPFDIIVTPFPDPSRSVKQHNDNAARFAAKHANKKTRPELFAVALLTPFNDFLSNILRELWYLGADLNRHALASNGF